MADESLKRVQFKVTNAQEPGYRRVTLLFEEDRRLAGQFTNSGVLANMLEDFKIGNRMTLEVLAVEEISQNAD